MFNLLCGFDFLTDIVSGVNTSRPKKNDRPLCEEMTLTQAVIKNEKEYHYEKVKRRILAEERMEKETDPRLKKRMKTLIENGIYDFSEIDKW